MTFFYKNKRKKNERKKSSSLMTFIHLLTYSKKLVLCRWRQNFLLLLYRRRLSLTNFNTILKNKIMSLQQYYQFEQHSSFFDLSAGSIKNFNFFNIHSDQQDEEEFDGAKVIKKITTTWEYSFSNISF